MVTVLLRYFKASWRWLTQAAGAKRSMGPYNAGAEAASLPERATPDLGDDDHFLADNVQAFPIGAELDLHTFRPQETRSLVEEYLHEAQAAGWREVRIVHGKGKGVQRRIVHGVLEKHPAVKEFAQAPPDRGGWGATLVWLKPVKTGSS